MVSTPSMLPLSSASTNLVKQIQSSFLSFPPPFLLLFPSNLESRAHRRRFKTQGSSNYLNCNIDLISCLEILFSFFKGTRKIFGRLGGARFIATADTLPDKGRHFRGMASELVSRMEMPNGRKPADAGPTSAPIPIPCHFIGEILD